MSSPLRKINSPHMPEAPWKSVLTRMCPLLIGEPEKRSDLTLCAVKVWDHQHACKGRNDQEKGAQFAPSDRFGKNEVA